MCESGVSFSTVIQLLLAAVAVEAVVEIIIDSEIFAEVRAYIKDLCYPAEPRANARVAYCFYKLNYFANCGYCMSVWIAAFAAIFCSVRLSGYWFVDWILSLFIIHRVSNLYHVLFMLIKHGRVHTITGELNHIIENKK